MSATAAKVKLEKGAMFFAEIDSPVGGLRLVGDGETLKQVWFLEGRRKARPATKEWVRSEKVFAEVTKQLRAYFRGELKQFNLPLEMDGTEFQRSVWNELREIPYGETRSYLDVAKLIGNAKAVRAVGLANGQNPIPIIVPCHRVIGSDGSLTGFGGGMENKRKLLDLEKGQIVLL